MFDDARRSQNRYLTSHEGLFFFFCGSLHFLLVDSFERILFLFFSKSLVGIPSFFFSYHSAFEGCLSTKNFVFFGLFL